MHLFDVGAKALEKGEKSMTLEQLSKETEVEALLISMCYMLRSKHTPLTNTRANHASARRYEDMERD